MNQVGLGELYARFVRNLFVCLSLSLTNALGQSLFESIKNEPFSIPEDDGNDLTHTFFNPNREGWLLKLGKGEGSPSSSGFPPQISPRNPPASLLSFPPVCCGGVRLTPAVENRLPALPSQLLQALSAQKRDSERYPSPLPIPSPNRAKPAPCVCVPTMRHHISGEHHGCLLGGDPQGELGEVMPGCACLALGGESEEDSKMCD